MEVRSLQLNEVGTSDPRYSEILVQNPLSGLHPWLILEQRLLDTSLLVHEKRNNLLRLEAWDDHRRVGSRDELNSRENGAQNGHELSLPSRVEVQISLIQEHEATDVLGRFECSIVD